MLRRSNEEVIFFYVENVAMELFQRVAKRLIFMMKNYAVVAGRQSYLFLRRKSNFGENKNNQKLLNTRDGNTKIIKI